MSITCKAAVIRNNKLAEPYKVSKPLSIFIKLSKNDEDKINFIMWNIFFSIS